MLNGPYADNAHGRRGRRGHSILSVVLAHVRYITATLCRDRADTPTHRHKTCTRSYWNAPLPGRGRRASALEAADWPPQVTGEADRVAAAALWTIRTIRTLPRGAASDERGLQGVRVVHVRRLRRRPSFRSQVIQDLKVPRYKERVAPEVGTRAQYVQCVGPWGQAALHLRRVQCAEGRYAQPARTYSTEAPGRTCQLSSAPPRCP